MDTYEGDDQEPLSLHKYLYGGGDPVNNIDPSGHDGMADVMMAGAMAVTLFCDGFSPISDRQEFGS
jgi:hypothetical protein